MSLSLAQRQAIDVNSLETNLSDAKAINQSLADKLSSTRRLTQIIDGCQPCKSCGNPFACAEYEYLEKWASGVTFLWVEIVCHDCAYPKKGEYLAAKYSRLWAEQERAEQEKETSNEIRFICICSACRD